MYVRFSGSYVTILGGSKRWGYGGPEGGPAGEGCKLERSLHSQVKHFVVTLILFVKEFEKF